MAKEVKEKKVAGDPTREAELARREVEPQKDILKTKAPIKGSIVNTVKPLEE